MGEVDARLKRQRAAQLGQYVDGKIEKVRRKNYNRLSSITSLALIHL
jgi:hypothetical protein